MTGHWATLWAVVLLACHFAGFICALHALMSVRTPQGTMAWVVSLVAFPYLTVPAYFVLGRSKFHGYRIARRVLEASSEASAAPGVPPFIVRPPEENGSLLAAVALATIPFLKGNDVELLIDGRATFDSIFAGIEQARHYVLVQFFIVHDDELGRELKSCLPRRAAAGVRVHFLFDEFGSRRLPRAFLRELREGG